MTPAMRITENLEMIRNGVSLLKRVQGDPGVCMCGCPMGAHPVWDNHSPLSQRDYYLSNMKEVDDV